jgi:hypothetical protein
LPRSITLVRLVHVERLRIKRNVVNEILLF